MIMKTKVRITPMTAITAVFGTIALAVGVLTATAHNIAFGLIFMAIGYVWHNEGLSE